MEDDGGTDLDAMDHALAIHEAGHAVVACALGAEVVFVEIDLRTGDGGARSPNFDDDIKNLAVCVAGCRAEHWFDARLLTNAKKGDYRVMRDLLSRLPETERRPARAEGYRVADMHLRANADVVRGIAAELIARRWSAHTTVIRIEGNDLTALLAGVR